MDEQERIDKMIEALKQLSQDDLETITNTWNALMSYPVHIVYDEYFETFIVEPA